MKGLNVLVTGGAGFIGSHLVRRCIEAGARVSVTVKYASVIDNVRLSACWPQLEIIEADLRNVDSLRTLAGRAYDRVFHLAAYNHVGDSFRHVNEALSSSAIATANLLECELEFERLIYISSSEAYGLQDNVPFVETAQPAPISPYAVGKYAGELYARMKRHQTGQDIVCLRPFNAFGPYQSEKAVIPELIRKCLAGETVETTTGKQTREFNFVANLVDGFVAAAMHPDAIDDVVNLGCGEEIAIRDLVKRIHRMSDSKSELRIGALPDRPTEIWRMAADASRAQAILGWQPRIAFDDGLRQTIDWYRRYLEVYCSPDSALNSL